MTGSLFSPPRVDRSTDAWEARSLRSILAPRSERNQPDLPLLTVARERGVFVRSDDDVNHNSVPEDLGNYKVARSGDLVINKMKAWQGSLGLAPVDGIVSPAYFVFEADFDVPRFGEYLLRSKPYVAKFGAASDGVRIGQWDLDIPRMRNIDVSLPQVDEQTAIVKYLAHANARIDKAIAAKRRLIALLEEQEQANAESLVRGDTEQDQISTGFPWLSRVPASWELLRIKKVLVGIEQGWSPQCDAQPAGPDEWGVLKAGCSNHGRFRSEENKKLPDGQEPRPELEVQHGDLLVSRANTRELVGSAAVALNPREKLIFSDKTFRLKVRADRADTEFLALVMGSRSSRDQIEAGAVGASHSMQNIGQGVIANLWIGLPPVDVQKAIVDELHRRSEEFEAVVGKTRREIALLREFRTRLVADVVTGQVDVRAIAATLPEAPESFDTAVPALDDELEEVLGEGEG